MPTQPLSYSPRPDVVAGVASAIESLPATGIRRVGVDGVDGAGKTTFADALAAVLADDRVEVIRVSADDFHHPRDVRYRRGRQSPEGFFLDSFDLAQLRGRLLDPLGPDGGRRFVRAVHDLATDLPVRADVEVARDGQVLVVDGLFLHRPELRDAWELSVFLDVPFEVSVSRMAGRDGSSPDPADPANRRYVEGQRHYLRTCRPHQRATIVIDNT